MVDISRRISKLETEIVPPNPLANLPLKELEDMAMKYATKHFGRKLSKAEFQRLSFLMLRKNLDLSEITERDLLPQKPKLS